ncbi:MAG: hypothetical protein ABIB11_00285, partial [Candidatus Omnitrophota bacterium]
AFVSDIEQEIVAGIYTNMGATLVEAKKINEVVFCSEKAISLSKHNSDMYVNRGKLFVRKAEGNNNRKERNELIRRAIKFYNKALKIDKYDYLACFYRAIAYEKLGDNLYALQDFLKIEKIDPSGLYGNRSFTQAIEILKKENLVKQALSLVEIRRNQINKYLEADLITKYHFCVLKLHIEWASKMLLENSDSATSLNISNDKAILTSA